MLGRLAALQRGVNMKNRRSLWLSAAAAWLMSLPMLSMALTVEGIDLPDTPVVGGQKLILNGAGFRKRGYFKTDVQGIYLSDRRTSLEAVYKLPGAKRILINVLKDIPGPTISRYFISDFKAVATEAEFKSLINEIGQIGNVYGSVHKVSRGDQVAIDWVPGKGIVCLFNGKPMTLDDNGAIYMNNELMFQIFMRIYVGPAVPDELRLNLLGLSKSMASSTVLGER